MLKIVLLFMDSAVANFESFASTPYFIYDFLFAEKKKLNSNPQWVFLLRFPVEFLQG
jgi:hypothetical protein